MTRRIGQTTSVETYSNLHAILAELQSLRAASQSRRYHGAPAPDLPSRGAVAEIVEGLVSVLYPRHFGPPGLTPDKTDEFLARTLAISLRSLQDQVRRELAFSPSMGTPTGI